jgi:UTP--glucose-1-phosphate uridylyltransferase
MILQLVGNEPVALLLADDFLMYSGNGITSDLISVYKKICKSQLSAMKFNYPDISKYGVIITDNKTGLIKGIIEKSDFESAPSDLASIGRYVLTYDIFDILRNHASGDVREVHLSDSINL